MTTKIGINCHHKLRGKDAPRDYSADEKAALWSFFERLQPATSLFMELDWARQAKRLVPGCKVVYRPEGDTNWQKETPQQFYNFHAPSCDGGQIILNVLNEPSGYVDKDNPDNLKQLAHWCAEVMDLFGKAGLPIVVPNFGVGHPDLTKLDHFRELWNGLVEWSNLHYFGYHPYWSYKGLDPLDGRLMRWKTLLAYIGSPNVKVIGTETGSDDLLDGSGKRGYKDYWTGDGYATVSVEAAEKHFNHPQFVGGCWYCYGNTGGDRVDPFKPGIGQDWWTFDFSADDEFKNKVLEYAKMSESTPAPARKYEPGKDYVYTGANSFNIRNLPSTAITTVVKGQLKKDDRVRFANVDAVEADGHIWQQGTVYKEGNLEITGWLAVGIIPLEEKQDAPPDEPPAPPITVLTRAELLLLAESHRKMAEMFQAAADRIAA